MKIDDFSSTRNRLITGFLAVFLVLFAGASGFYLLGHGEWSFDDCMYMTAITVSTVGFGEVIDIASVPGARLYTVLIILSSMGILVYFGSSIVALFVEGEIKQYFRRKKMAKQIQKLSGHIIICGAGSTGIFVIKELIATRNRFVVIDESEERIRRVAEEETGTFPYLVGDASEEHTLIEAGIDSARGLIAALPEDKDNLFVVITARQMNQKMRIISRGVESTIADKLKRAGANAVVSPNAIGGLRMASEMIRPQVVSFLDQMLKVKDSTLRVEEVNVPPGSKLCGKTLGQADIQSMADVLVVAAKQGPAEFCYNPPPDFVLESQTALIVLGPVDQVEKLRKAV